MLVVIGDSQVGESEKRSVSVTYTHDNNTTSCIYYIVIFFVFYIFCLIFLLIKELKSPREDYTFSFVKMFYNILCDKKIQNKYFCDKINFFLVIIMCNFSNT